MILWTEAESWEILVLLAWCKGWNRTQEAALGLL